MARGVRRDPWLVATWPGMGAVGLLAGHYLVQGANAQAVLEMVPEPWFDVSHLQVKAGIVQPARRPRGVLYALPSEDRKRPDLLVFLGEAQPASQGWEYCEALLDEAAVYGIGRVVTFAAMAAPIEPRSPARVYAVATGQPLLDEALRQGTVALGDGQVGGLNGVLLGAAAKRGLEGLCLLGEFPYFANEVPNPKAAASVLRVFSGLSGFPLDLTDIEAQGRDMEEHLVDLLRQMQSAQKPAEGPREGGEEEPEFPAAAEEPEEEAGGPTAEQRSRIERMFQEAAIDRKKALALKAELDRLGVFREYEDRFLDLFRRAE